MPKSKRDRKLALTKTTKKVGVEFKQALIDRIRQNVDDYSHLYVFSVANERNNHLKEVREAWRRDNRTASFFLGKNRIMAVALGREDAEEYNDKLSRVSRLLRGANRGLMLTNESPEVVKKFFADHAREDYARTGGVATADVDLQQGPMEQFSHAMEPQLRALGLPTTLKRGVVHLLQDHKVCKKGDHLTSEQARILKLLGRKQATFSIRIIAEWAKGKQDQTATFDMHDDKEEQEQGPEASDSSDDDLDDGNQSS